MNLRGAFASRPWIAWPATALVVCVLADIALLFRRSALDDEFGLQRDREREMTRIAQEYRNLKADMTRRSERLAPPGTLDVERIEALAREHRAAGDVHVTTPPPRTDNDVTERRVDVSLAKAIPVDLVAFLRAVEALNPAVRTRTLLIVESRESAGAEGKTFVDAKVTFSAYEKATSEPE